MIRASNFVNAANTPGLIGTPYEKMDCQALIEKMLSICGEKQNWKGSNDIARNALSWLGTKEECSDQYGMIPPGAWLFTLKNDRGEELRGYHDGKGNFAHIGAYLGNGVVIHSTTGGVQYDSLDSKRWNMVGLAACIDYTNTLPAAPDDTLQQLIQARTCIDTIINRLKNGGIS